MLESGQNKKRRANARLSKRTLEKLFSSGLDGDFQILVLFTSLCVLSGLILGLFHSEAGETISGQIGHQEAVQISAVCISRPYDQLLFVQLCNSSLELLGRILSGDYLDRSGGESTTAGEHGSTCSSNNGQTSHLQERTTRQNHNSILLKNNSTNEAIQPFWAISNLHYKVGKSQALL